jgi:hypothetical protein
MKIDFVELKVLLIMSKEKEFCQKGILPYTRVHIIFEMAYIGLLQASKSLSIFLLI